MKTNQLIKKTIYHLGVLVLMLSVLTSCKDDDLNDGDSSSGEVSLTDVIEYLGEKSAVENVNTITYTVKGHSYEHEQGIPNTESQLTSNYFVYDFYSKLNERKLRMDYDSIQFYHPTFYDTDGPLLIINDQKGSVSRDFIWKSYFLGVVDPHATFASEIEANLKNQKMANPIALVKEILKDHGAEQKTTNGVFSIETRIDDLDIELVIDPQTYKPIKSQIKEADFLQGDVMFEVLYKDWITVSGVKYPSKIEYYLNSDLIKSEDLSNINLTQRLQEDLFTPEPVAQSLAYDEEQGNFGIYHSQFYHRWNSWNIGWPEPVNNGAIDLGSFDLTQFSIPSQYISDNIKIMGRPDNRLWNVAIKTSNGVVMVDSPLNQKWTRSLINATKLAFPNEDLVGVISTHTHHDHFAGIREAAFETGKVYIAKEGVPFLNQVLDSEHKLYEDNLQKNPRNVEVVEVSDITYLDNGAVEIHRVKPDHSSAVAHGSDMLVVYIPGEELIIQADQLWNGVFMMAWNGFTYRGFTPEGRAQIRNNAKYLLDYINEKNLKVSKIAAMHGGLGPFSDLVQIANSTH